MLAHRLRRLSEIFVEGYSEWLPSLGVTAPARSLSTLLLLDREGPLGVTEIGARLKLSHPLMIKLVGALEAQGLVAVRTDASDARRRPVALTPAGRGQVKRVKRAIAILDRAYADLGAETGADLIGLVEHIEQACVDLSFGERLRRATHEITQKQQRQQQRRKAHG